MSSARRATGKAAGKSRPAFKKRSPSATTASAAVASHPLVREVLAQTRTPRFRSYLKDLLLELCRIKTTPHPEVAPMRTAENRCFEILERELAPLPFGHARLERRPINPAIQAHANFSLLHFTKTAARPEGLTPQEVYADRGNLLYTVPGTLDRPGQSVALNAHLDVVAPYFPPTVRGKTVYGRGACDDKGPVVGIVGALKVLSNVLAKAGCRLNRNVVAMFVVEEETGGNGSLSLALDRDLKGAYDTMLVSECTGLKIHPANRGAVWYRAQLQPPPRVSGLEMSAFIIEEMEKEGAAIRAESRHELFPQRPVQTCHGILGPFGEHPSRICGAVEFSIRFERPLSPATEALVKDCLASGLAAYLGMYGDKTKVLDPSTGRPMVATHYDLRRTRRGFQVQVHGAAGHMGSVRERDGAITKTASLVRSLVYSKARLEQAAGTLHLALGPEPAKNPEDCLVLEGGQGFVPTHNITEVMQRLERAAQRGAEACLRRLGRDDPGHQVVRVTYEKLHNVAFDGDPKSKAMGHALAAAAACGLGNDEPVLGWTVSCDARLFATEYPGLPVLTFGPGQLVHAHSDHEQIELEDIRAAAECLALFVLLQTATIEPSP